MTTIVMNTANAAVTEYDWEFESLCSTHAGSADGLMRLGGNDDNGAPIEARFLGGKALVGSGRKASVGFVYLSMQGSGTGVLRVAGSDTWEYEFQVHRVSRAKPGQGIRDNYLALGFRNKAGADFRLDRIDAEVAVSPQRRSAA